MLASKDLGSPGNPDTSSKDSLTIADLLQEIQFEKAELLKSEEYYSECLLLKNALDCLRNENEQLSSIEVAYHSVLEEVQEENLSLMKVNREYRETIDHVFGTRRWQLDSFTEDVTQKENEVNQKIKEISSAFENVYSERTEIQKEKEKVCSQLNEALNSKDSFKQLALRALVFLLLGSFICFVLIPGSRRSKI